MLRDLMIFNELHEISESLAQISNDKSDFWTQFFMFFLGVGATLITNFFVNRKVEKENKIKNVKTLMVRLNELNNELKSIGNNIPISKLILKDRMLYLLKEFNDLINLLYEVMPAKSLDVDIIQAKEEIKNILYSIDTINDSELKCRINKSKNKLYTQMKKLYSKHRKAIQSEKS